VLPKNIDIIRSYVENKKIWVILNETTDIEWHCVVNVIVETLELNGLGKHFLINAEVLEKIIITPFQNFSRNHNKFFSIMILNTIKYYFYYVMPQSM